MLEWTDKNDSWSQVGPGKGFYVVYRANFNRWTAMVRRPGGWMEHGCPTREEAKAACELHANTSAAAPTRHATPSARPECGTDAR